MESFRWGAGLRNPGKQPYLPPKSPFPSLSAPVYGDRGSSGSREGARLRQHQRTSSESFLIDEQPLWLDELLNEPETPVKRPAHRRSSSDSFAYLDGSRINSNFNNLAQECRQNAITSMPLWGSQEFDIFKDVQPHFVEENKFNRSHDIVWMSGHNMVTYSSSLPFEKEKGMHSGSSSLPFEKEKGMHSGSSGADEKLEIGSSKDLPGLPEKKDASVAKYAQPDTDPRRVKQQFAQRSRVRKLQYIAELERNVQTLQAEGLEVSAELDFVDQQNLMLSLENKALKQRLDSLTQEQIIKHFQQEMLEREIARLRLLFQQQPQPPIQPPILHGHRSIRDLDSQFANISLKHKVVNSGRDPTTGLHI